MTTETGNKREMATRSGDGASSQSNRGLARWNPFSLFDELLLGRPSQLQVEVDRGDLVIRGETRFEDEAKEDHYYRLERRYGSFYRRVPLGFDVDPEKVQADLHDGILELRIPKPLEMQSTTKRIPVR